MLGAFRHRDMDETTTRPPSYAVGNFGRAESIRTISKAELPTRGPSGRAPARELQETQELEGSQLGSQ